MSPHTRIQTLPLSSLYPMGIPAPVPDRGGPTSLRLSRSLVGAASAVGVVLAFILLPGSSLLVAGLWLGRQGGGRLPFLRVPTMREQPEPAPESS